MKHPVVLISRDGMAGWFGRSALRRSDIEVHPASSCETAFQAVLKADCHLAVLEEWEGCSHFQNLLSDLLFSIKKENFRLILITNTMPPGKGTHPISEVLPQPCPEEAFDKAVLRALGLGQRAGRRHLVRLHVGAHSREESNLGMVTCVVLNGGGMLVESPRPLPVGKTLYWSFQGVPELKGLRIAGTVLRQAAPEGGAKGPCYAVGFDEEALAERTQITLYLAQGV